jgi:hypothetical protein
MKPRLVRRAVTAGTVLVLAGTAMVGAFATVITPPTARQGSLVSFGPLMDNGFPTSYKDSKGVRLEACTTADDLMCAATAGPTYDPDQPLAFPTNFPDEFFYQLASAVLPVNPADAKERLLVETNLEGAFATGPPIAGDQMVFARIRIKDVDVPEGTTWRITHPYGIDEITAGPKGIFQTMDVGTAPGVFSGALASRLGPFLKWDPSVAPAAPVGYIGDPGTLHKVTGSPYGTNFIKVETKNADGSYTPVLGTGQVSPGVWDDQFSLQGRLAVNSGVDVDAAYFTGNDSNGFLDVYASSDAARAIQVDANATLGTPTVPMHELDGHYFARIAVTGKIVPGTKITVSNTGDKPVATKTATPVDQVNVTAATYNADNGDLTITATSSDKETGPLPVLTVEGFGPLTADGTPTVFHSVTPTPNTAPPAFVRVTSSAGGSDSSTLAVTGAGFGALAPIARFTLPAAAQVGQPIPLDGSASTGNITSYAWSTTNGTVTPATGVASTWTPATAGAATVTLTVTTTTGATSFVTNSATVTPAAGVTANAGPPQTKTRGQVVTLAGSATGQTSVAWTQDSGPPVTLSNAASLTPTFTYPVMKLPVGPVGHINTGYVVDSPAAAKVVMRLTAKGAGTTSATSTVTISPTAETFTLLTARYRTRGDWRVTGTSNITAGQTVAMVLGNKPTGAYIGQATADAAGAFSFKGGVQPIANGSTVTYVSSTGGSTTGTLLITP